MMRLDNVLEQSAQLIAKNWFYGNKQLQENPILQKRVVREAIFQHTYLRIKDMLLTEGVISSTQKYQKVTR